MIGIDLKADLLVTLRHDGVAEAGGKYPVPSEMDDASTPWSARRPQQQGNDRVLAGQGFETETVNLARKRAAMARR